MDAIKVYWFLSLFPFLKTMSNAQIWTIGYGPVQLSSTIKIQQGFSFKFRSCNPGILLYQGDNSTFFQVTLSKTDSSKFSQLSLSWKSNGTVRTETLQGHYALDRNQLIETELFIDDIQGPIFRITKPISLNQTISNYSALLNISNTGPLLLGVNSYIGGCFYDGRGVKLSTAMNISRYQVGCPLEDQRLCSSSVCPIGFAGRYCNKNIDECGSYPCHSHATCVDGINSYKCVCGPQWTGPTCATFLGSVCTPSPCNAGVCQESKDRNSYTCACPQGYTGKNCESIFYPCMIEPCKNGASCYNWTTSGSSIAYNCTCKTGFRGIHCEFNINDCSNHPCQNGKCIDGINNYTCNCNSTGFEGRHCQNDINECSTVKPCKNNGTCHNTYGRYTCTCKSGYTGPTCEVDVHECRLSPCLNNGTCIERFGYYQCSCKPGYTGQNCQTNIMECTANICGNGTCIDGINNYTCNCSAGFTGRNCEVNINECSSSPCQNNGSCQDRINGYECKCLGAYNGTHCEIWNDVCRQSPCLNNATCITRNRTVSGFECNCTGTGYGGPECQFVTGVCYPRDPCVHGKCIDHGSFYNCTCNPGYQGVNCSEDINECNPNPCQFGGTCANTIGSYTCKCTPFSTGKNCSTDIHKCSPACANGICKNNIGVQDSCLCHQGWFDAACDKRVDYCAQKKKTFVCEHGKCENFYSESKNDAICVCYEGYMGYNCSKDVNECERGFCRNNISCTNGFGNYSCGCIAGYTGKNCTGEINECSSNPCVNNGTCNDLLNGYNCTCRFGFNGTNCQNDINWCAPGPCQNGGNCTDGIETYNCSCYKGYQGRNCEIDVNECKSNPCQLGGICIEKSNLTALVAHGISVTHLQNNYADRNGYICMCQPGTNGTNCQNDINECATKPCMNNATCHDFLNGYNCTCLPGFSGKNCSVNINECSSSPCFNNATCRDNINGFECNCKTNYTGVRCESAINQCLTWSPCVNGGNCYQIGTGYGCVCPNGFGGQNCAQQTTVNFDVNSQWVVDTPGNVVQMRLRTTLKSGLVLQATSLSENVFIGLEESGIFVINDAGVKFRFPSSIVNDGHWHNWTIAFSSSNINITVDSRKFTANIGISGITRYHLGSAQSASAKIKEILPGFVGCIQDVKIDRTHIIPGHHGSLNGATIGSCTWRQFCANSPCKNGGQCNDLWNKYTCVCNRRFYGSDCNGVYEAFTFGNSVEVKPIPKPSPSTNRTSRRRRSLSSPASNNTHYILLMVNTTFNSNTSLSLSFRTRSQNGILFIVSSNGPNSTSRAVDSYMSLQLINGRLNYYYNHNAETKALASGTIVNDGQWHDVEVNKENVTLDKTVLISQGVVSDLPCRYFYIGGVDNITFFESALRTTVQYSGCMQAVSFKGSTVATKPLSGGGPTQFANSSTAQAGCNGTDVCGVNPCQNGGNCTDLWNAYSCSCPKGYYGDTCSLFGCSIMNNCTTNTTCFDLPGQHGKTACISPSTFNGSESSMTFTSLTVSNTSSVSFSLRTRSVNALILGTATNSSHYLAVGLSDGKVKVVLRYWGMNTESHVQGGRSVNDGAWHDITVKTTSTATMITIDSILDTSNASLSLDDRFKLLLQSNGLVIGRTSQSTLTTRFQNNFFKGCIDKFLIGNDLIHFNSINKTNVRTGCLSDNTCEAGPCVRGQCVDTFDSYECKCPQHYSGKSCNITTNVTCGFTPSPCMNSATCVNISVPSKRVFSQSGMDMFTCNCLTGYSGDLCKVMIDYCAANPCKNSGNCTGLVGDYSCTCHSGYTGKDCSVNINECSSNPCRNGGNCTDNVNGYNCVCPAIYTGINCEDDVNECLTTPCKNNATCRNFVGGYNCTCLSGYFGDNCDVLNCLSNPCQNNGKCTASAQGYQCQCTSQYTGTNCQTAVKKPTSDTNVGMWIGIAAAILVVILIILICCCRYCKGNTGMQGTYSPSRQEKGQVELASLPPMPPKERLI